MIGDDEGFVIVAGLKLVVGVDLVSLLGTVEVAQRLVDARLLEGSTEHFEIDAVRGKGDGIGLDADGGFLTAANGDEAHTGDLGNLLRETRIGVILHLREGIGF